MTEGAGRLITCRIDRIENIVFLAWHWEMGSDHGERLIIKDVCE
jgi:hypothetical protein